MDSVCSDERTLARCVAVNVRCEANLAVMALLAGMDLNSNVGGVGKKATRSRRRRNYGTSHVCDRVMMISDER